MLDRRPSSQRAADIAARSVLTHFLERTAADPGRIAVRWKSRGIWEQATWADYRRRVERIALGLLRLGVGEETPVPVLGRPSPGWLYADLAVQSIGALPLAVHATTPAERVAAILEELSPPIVVLTRRDQLQRFLALEPAGSPVKTLVVGGVDVPKDIDERVMPLPALEALADDEPGRWQSLAAARRQDSPAVIALSAGTTGDGRLAVLTDANLLGAWSWLAELPAPPTPSDRIVSSMAIGLLAERALSQLVPIVFGSVIHFPEDELSLIEARREIRPTVFFALPQVWEAEAAAAAEALDAAPPVRRAAYRLAERAKRGSGRGPGARLADLLVMRPLLDRFGYRRLRLALTGGDRLSPAAERQWRTWGLPLHGVYGTVECSGAAAVLEDGGTAVTARPDGVEMTVSDAGELLVSGPGIAGRYWDGAAPSRTGDGRLLTGDRGVLDRGVDVLGPSHRSLRLTDGTRVEPGAVEACLRGSRYITRAAVVGDGWPALGALLEPDLTNLASWARRRGMSFTAPAALLDEPDVHAHLAREVEAVNSELEREGRPRVAVHQVLASPFEPGVHVSPSGTVRPAAGAGHAVLVDAMGARLSGGRDELGSAAGGHVLTVAKPALRSARP